MTEARFDEYYPFEAAPGHHSIIPRWRRMAGLWCASGVVRADLGPTPGEPNPLQCWSWDGPWLGGGATWTATCAPGGVYVHGFYGANYGHKGVRAEGSGLLVARYDPAVEDIQLVHRPGVGAGGEVKDPDGWWEVPIAYMNAEAPQIVDLRTTVPLPHVVPPITEMPASTPRGLIYAISGPGTPLGPSWTGYMTVAYPHTSPRFAPGRNYRVSATYWMTENSIGAGMGGQVRLWVRDDPWAGGAGGMREQAVLYEGFGDLYQGQACSASLQVPNAGPGLVAVMECNTWTQQTCNFRFDANSCRVEVEDIGA